MGSEKRRIAEEDDDVVEALLDRRSGRKDGMAGAEPLALFEDGDIVAVAPDRSGDLVSVSADDQRQAVRAGLKRRPAHMAHKRQATDLMQHLGALRAHSCAFSGRENARQTASRHCGDRSMQVVTFGAELKTPSLLVW